MLVRLPSLTVTRTLMRSPRSPLPAVARFSVVPVGARDVGAVARPLVAGGERVALGVVARHRGGQRLAGGGQAGAIVTVSTTGAVLAAGDRPGERVGRRCHWRAVTVIVTLTRPARMP